MTVLLNSYMQMAVCVFIKWLHGKYGYITTNSREEYNSTFFNFDQTCRALFGSGNPGWFLWLSSTTPELLPLGTVLLKIQQFQGRFDYYEVLLILNHVKCWSSYWMFLAVGLLIYHYIAKIPFAAIKVFMVFYYISSNFVSDACESEQLYCLLLAYVISQLKYKTYTKKKRQPYG